MPREILVVKREKLFEEKMFEGFCRSDEHPFVEKILDNFEYVERNEALENNPNFQQIIPYVWLVNPKSKKVFLYVRSVEGEESRLHNKFSGGVGGHIDKDTDEKAENPLVEAMMRELREEVDMTNYPKPYFVGYINDDSDAVNRVHFAVVAVAETEEDAKPAMHMKKGEFYSVNEVDELFLDKNNDIEKWTRISWPAIRERLT